MAGDLLDALAPLGALAAAPREVPWCGRVLVADTNYLASTACHLATDPGQTALLLQALTGARAHAYIAAHVPDEMPRAITRVAAAKKNPDLVAPALHMWRSQLAPVLRVVDLPIREYLDPYIHDVLRTMLAKGADPDDLPTAALARFLAPAVLLSEDSVFFRAGLPIPASVPAGVLAAASATRGELAALGAARTGATAAHLGGQVTTAAVAALRAHPKTALVAMAAGAMTGWAMEMRRPGSTHHLVQGLTGDACNLARRTGQRAAQLLRYLVAAQQSHAQALAAAVTVPGRAHQQLPEAAAAVLARAGVPLSVADLRSELADPSAWTGLTHSHPVSRQALTDALEAHWAFIHDHRGWTLGRPVTATSREPH